MVLGVTCQDITRAAAACSLSGAAAPPALDEEGALRMVQAVMTAKPSDKAQAEQMLRDAVAKVCESLRFVDAWETLSFVDARECA
jgi:hypothetical protein